MYPGHHLSIQTILYVFCKNGVIQYVTFENMPLKFQKEIQKTNYANKNFPP